MLRIVVLIALFAPCTALIEDVVLPTLSYAYSGLAPAVDAQTMMLHHSKHTQAYADGLNEALAQLRSIRSPLLTLNTTTDLVLRYMDAPADVQSLIRNMGGGYVNHVFFFDSLRAPRDENHPEKSSATLAAALEFASTTRNSFEQFKMDFTAAAKTVFGSGWTWVMADTSTGGISLTTTPNQDLPNVKGKLPILSLDLWEHAYYLSYGPDRTAYINAWWSLVNWDVVAKRYLECLIPAVDVAKLMPSVPLQGPTTVTVTTTTAVGGGIQSVLDPPSAP